MNILCITNRALAKRPFLEQVEIICSRHPFSIVLREKDLSLSKYEDLAKDVLKICFKNEVPLLLHGIDGSNPIEILKFLRANNDLSDMKFSGIHLSMNDYYTALNSNIDFLKNITIGVSAHSIEDAIFCEMHNATYITASHIFETDCKKDLPPRGLPFLNEICSKTSLPVFALGGINKENASSCIKEGAYGVSIMSECMKWDD